MTRSTFILSLPFIGAIGKLIAGEKKEEIKTRDYGTGQTITVSGVTGNTDANGEWVIKQIMYEKDKEYLVRFNPKSTEKIFVSEDSGETWVELTRHKIVHPQRGSANGYS